MPWTDKQVRLFAAAAHNPDIAAKHGMQMGKARTMEMEAPPAQRSQAMRGPRKKRNLKDWLKGQ